MFLFFKYNLERFNKFCHPDENYSREVMQLFTVGTCKLNIDGSSVTGKTGCSPTYKNDVSLCLIVPVCYPLQQSSYSLIVGYIRICQGVSTYYFDKLNTTYGH